MRRQDVVNFETARFHIDTGPASLFARVRFKVGARRQLRLHAEHFQDRAGLRDAPIEDMRAFDAAKWRLRTAEVRTDTGKFVNSAWHRRIDGRDWWIVIGLHDTVMTVIDTRKHGLGLDIVTAGPLYEMVDCVNRGLMERECDGADS